MISQNKKIKCFFVLFIIFSSIFLNGCTKEEVNKITGDLTSKGNEVKDYVGDFISNESVRHETKVEIAGKIAFAIKDSNLQQIDLTNIESYEDYKKMVDNLNLVIKIINDKSGSNIKYFSKEIEAYDKFMLEVKRYSPLIDNYNYLITYSNEFNPENDESVNRLLNKTAGFTVEALLIFGGVFYRFAFITVGHLASAFGLTKLASVCGPCVSAVMSNGHWVIRNGLVEKTSEYAEEGVSNVI